VNYRQIIWESGPTAAKRFQAWCEGRTGYPIVDAGMRQLITQGWMHNRVRMITASFLVKDLHIDWRTGAQFFEDHLADGDIASNRGNWQWVAGTGTDAAPYFRIFNPIRQAKLFDPHGQYVKQFVPELRGIPDRYIHEPWLWDGFSGIDYPEPIVDHFAERKRCLEYYRRGS
jgi:deoxyribodipyrimidine photo-lyase